MAAVGNLSIRSWTICVIIADEERGGLFEGGGNGISLLGSLILVSLLRLQILMYLKYTR